MVPIYIYIYIYRYRVPRVGLGLLDDGVLRAAAGSACRESDTSASAKVMTLPTDVHSFDGIFHALSLVQWMFTGIVQLMFISVSSGVLYFAPICSYRLRSALTACRKEIAACLSPAAREPKLSFPCGCGLAALAVWGGAILDRLAASRT